MPTIVFANMKGGSGKTTAGLVLGGQILDAGGKVVFLEGDPNTPLSSWASDREDCAVIVAADKEPKRDKSAGFGAPSFDASLALRVIEAVTNPGTRCIVIANENEQTMLAWMAAAKRWAQWVICDPEGSRNLWMATAISQADLVLLPFAPTALDAAQVANTIEMIQQFSLAGRETPFRVLVTRANPVPTRDERAIRRQILEGGVPLLSTSLLDRSAYRAMFRSDARLSELDGEQVNGLEKARANAAAYTNEVLETLRKLKRSEAA